MAIIDHDKVCCGFAILNSSGFVSLAIDLRFSVMLGEGTAFSKLLKLMMDKLHFSCPYTLKNVYFAFTYSLKFLIIFLVKLMT